MRALKVVAVVLAIAVPAAAALAVFVTTQNTAGENRGRVEKIEDRERVAADRLARIEATVAGIAQAVARIEERLAPRGR